MIPTSMWHVPEEEFDMGYDEWLVAPFQAAEAESERFYDFCDRNEVDPDSEEAYALYEEWLFDMDAAAAEMAAEARMEEDYFYLDASDDFYGNDYEF